MQKILLTNDLKNLFFEKNSFLDRADIKVLSAATNAEVLKIHRMEKVDLIVANLDTPGIKSEVLFDTIKKSKELQEVSTIIICNDTLTHRERSKECRANAVFTMPVDSTLLHMKMQQLLNIAPRKSYRASLAVAIQGKFQSSPLPFWTENISSSGILIRTEEPLSKGDGIFFSFFLNDGNHISGYGEIKRIFRPETTPGFFLYGIRFTNVDPGVQSAINAAITA
ncbi:MAG: PilZ domain-containing protein [Nitrospirae bacterium]|nr:PilZ domain-containing protein [Nitrospirota bacterium]